MLSQCYFIVVCSGSYLSTTLVKVKLTCNRLVGEAGRQNTRVVQMIGSLQELLRESHTSQHLTDNKTKEHVPHDKTSVGPGLTVCIPGYKGLVSWLS